MPLTMTKPETILFADSAHGVYIPQHFAETIKRDCVAGLEPDDWTILEAGPDHELYWDVWTGVCDNAVITDTDGIKYRLWQDGDLWLIPDGMEWSDENDCFEWPRDEGDVPGWEGGFAENH